MVRIAGGLGSVARVLLVLGAGAAGGAALTTHLGAQAQDGSAAAIAALTARVDALEKKADEPIKAPFEVVGANGQTIFSVTEQGGGGELDISGGNGTARLSANGGQPELVLFSGNNTASVKVAGAGPRLNLSGAGGSLFLAPGGGTSPAISVSQGAEQVLTFDTASGGPQLVLNKGGHTARIVAMPEKTGMMVDANGTHFQMGDIENIRGFVASRGDLPFAGLGSFGDDKYRVVIFNGSDKPVFTGGFDRATGKAGVFVGDDSGQTIATITAGEGSGGGELKLSPPGGEAVVTLGPAEGGDGATLKLGSGEDGLIATADASTATVTAKIGGKSTLMGATPKATGFVVSSQNRPLASLGDNGDGKAFMRIFGGGSTPVLVAGYGENGRLAFRIGEAGKPMAVLEQSETSAGQLDLYGPNGGRSAISIGVAAGGTAGVRIYNSGGNPAATLGANSDGAGSLRILKDAAVVAGVEGDPEGGAVYVAKGGSELAVMKALGASGAIAISNGHADLVRLVDNGVGGSMVISNGGGNDVLEARADPSVGGIVCVNYKDKEKCLGRGLTGMEGFH